MFRRSVSPRSLVLLISNGPSIGSGRREDEFVGTSPGPLVSGLEFVRSVRRPNRLDHFVGESRLVFEVQRLENGCEPIGGAAKLSRSVNLCALEGSTLAWTIRHISGNSPLRSSYRVPTTALLAISRCDSARSSPIECYLSLFERRSRSRSSPSVVIKRTPPRYRSDWGSVTRREMKTVP